MSEYRWSLMVDLEGTAHVDIGEAWLDEFRAVASDPERAALSNIVADLRDMVVHLVEQIKLDEAKTDE